MDKPITMGLLLEYTDSFLIPKIHELMKEEIGASEERMKIHVKQEVTGSEYRIKDYIDRKLSDHTVEMFKRLDERYHKEKQFKQKVVDLFRKHHIGSDDEIAFLDGLAQ